MPLPDTQYPETPRFVSETVIVEKYAHFLLNKTCCGQCPLSYVMLQALLKQYSKALRYLLAFVSQARDEPLAAQIRLAGEFASKVEVAASSKPQVDVLKR